MSTINYRHLKFMTNTIVSVYAINHDHYPESGYTYSDDLNYYVFTDNFFNYIHSIESDEDINALNTLTSNFYNYLYSIPMMYSYFGITVFDLTSIENFNKITSFVSSGPNDFMNELKIEYLLKEYKLGGSVLNLYEKVDELAQKLSNVDKYGYNIMKYVFKPKIKLYYGNSNTNYFASVFDAHNTYRHYVNETNNEKQLRINNTEIFDFITKAFNSTTPFFIKDVNLYVPNVLDFISKMNINVSTYDSINALNSINAFASDYFDKKIFNDCLNSFIMKLVKISNVNNILTGEDDVINFNIIKNLLTDDNDGNFDISDRIFNFKNVETVNDINTSNVFYYIFDTLILNAIFGDEFMINNYYNVITSVLEYINECCNVRNKMITLFEKIKDDNRFE